MVASKKLRVAGKKSRVAGKKLRVVKKLQTMYFIESAGWIKCVKITLSFSKQLYIGLLQYETLSKSLLSWFNGSIYKCEYKTWKYNFNMLNQQLYHDKNPLIKKCVLKETNKTCSLQNYVKCLSSQLYFIESRVE
jgi:hypothetical protein